MGNILRMLGSSHNGCRPNSTKILFSHDAKFGVTDKIQHPLIKEGQCLSCHSSYDEERHKEALKPVDVTCVRCHEQEKLGRSHPIGPGIIDPNTQEAMTCVSTCHNPHQSEFKNLLSYRNSMDLCLGCHKDF